MHSEADWHELCLACWQPRLVTAGSWMNVVHTAAPTVACIQDTPRVRPLPLHPHPRGDISTTISFTTTQKVALSTSNTVGSAFSAAFSVLPKFGPVALPEYSFEKGWSKSETTTNTVTKTTDTTIETTPKLTINPQETAALYMMMCAVALANTECSLQATQQWMRRSTGLRGLRTGWDRHRPVPGRMLSIC